MHMVYQSFLMQLESSLMQSSLFQLESFSYSKEALQLIRELSY